MASNVKKIYRKKRQKRDKFWQASGKRKTTFKETEKREKKRDKNVI